MTENEAKDCIEQLKHYNLKGKLTTPLNNDISMLWDGAFGIVMDLFEEIQQYRAIGTIEEFKALKECFGHTVPKSRGKAIYDKAIDDFVKRIENHTFTERTEEYSNSVSFMREIRKIAGELKRKMNK